MQMVRALIENAVKYSPQGSLIRIETASSPRTYILSVIDAGCGIPKAHLNKLTDRFYRVDADRNRASGGSGLGLSIVDGLIKTHGGHLQITSTEGEGTCVSLHLPTTLTPTEEKNNH
jgi:signal transduction histidine kinase